MKKVRSAVIMPCLVFLLCLAAVGCARQSTDTMNKDKMDNTMEKTMDTMDAEKMDNSMKKDIPNNMK